MQAFLSSYTYLIPYYFAFALFSENDLAILHNKIDALNCRFDFLEEGVDKILKLLSRSDVQDAAVLEEAYPYLPCDGATDLGEFEKSLATEEGKMTLVTL